MKPILLNGGKIKRNPAAQRRWKMNDCRLKVQRFKLSKRYKQDKLSFEFGIPNNIQND